MQELTITLSGEITASNFDEWKQGLIEQIKSTETALSTDDDYAAASQHVKQFKAAEKALKAAKQSALNQASDIQALFDAIDAVSAEARAARLTLERQLKARKLEIRASAIETGLANIQQALDERGEDFALIDHAEFLDRTVLEAAVKGKSSLATLEKAVNKATAAVIKQMDEKAESVAANAKRLAALDTGDAAMFQDRSMLLALTADKLDKTIESRLAAAAKVVSQPPAADAAVADVATPDTTGDKLEIDFDMQDSGDDADASDAGTAQPSDEKAEEFDVRISLLASRRVADEVVADVRSRFDDHAAVQSIELIIS